MRLNNILKHVAIFTVLGLLNSTACAQNLGNYGQVFPIAEEDLRQFIMKRLQAMNKNGELQHHQRLIQERVAQHIIRPEPLPLLPTKTPVSYRVDPTVFVTEDVWTDKGVLLAKKGMPLNPFHHMQYNKTLIFFNAEDASQVVWVKKHYADYNHVKFILTGGDIREASNVFGRIYFDLKGLITTRMNIKHVPSVVNQEGLFWKIQEIGAQDA